MFFDLEIDNIAYETLDMLSRTKQKLSLLL